MKPRIIGDVILLSKIPNFIHRKFNGFRVTGAIIDMKNRAIPITINIEFIIE